ncbi:hypothetical protein AAG906_017280 [Vitis piasezkii]
MESTADASILTKMLERDHAFDFLASRKLDWISPIHYSAMFETSEINPIAVITENQSREMQQNSPKEELQNIQLSSIEWQKLLTMDEEDSMIMSWLWNSMLLDVSGTCMFLTRAREIWETVRQTYSKMQDVALIYEIKTKITTKQGLNLKFNQVRVQVLGKETLPSFDEGIKRDAKRQGSATETVKNESTRSFNHDGVWGTYCKKPCKFPTSYALSASNTLHNDSWVIDFRATDHMTCSSQSFITYNPCPSNKKVKIADDSFTTVAGMIQLAKEKDGFYFLETKGGSCNQPSHSYLSNNFSFNKDDIWLQHFCLAHPPFSLLKDTFPLLLKNVDVSNLHCDICEFAKHHRVSFPLSNTRTSSPFSLIHSDIFGDHLKFLMFRVQSGLSHLLMITQG